MANPSDPSGINSQSSGLSYEDDIAPLKQRFFQRAFSDPRLVASGAAARSSLGVSKSLDESYKDSRGLLDMQDVSNQRKVQFETSVFELERAREKANRERTMMTDLKPVSDILSGIAGDPNLDSTQRKAIGNQYAMTIADKIAINPAIASAVDSFNRSISSEQSDRVTAMDYLRTGADPAILKAYEQTTGKPLGANDQIPVGIVATGVQSASDKKAKSSQFADAEQRQYDRTKAMMDSVDKAGLFKNELKEEDPTKFDSAQAEMDIMGTISAFGTPEQRQAAIKANALDKLKIAKTISTDWNMNPKAGPSQPARRSAGSWATE